MNEELFRTVLIRQMIEHRFVRPGVSMAQAINQVAYEAELSPRYVNMVLIGDRLSSKTLDAIEDSITRLSDDEGGVPAMCCNAEAVDVIKRELFYHFRGGSE